jgi:hypothetical protein
MTSAQRRFEGFAASSAGVGVSTVVSTGRIPESRDGSLQSNRMHKKYAIKQWLKTILRWDRAAAACV